jgi:hypothetical protein
MENERTETKSEKKSAEREESDFIGCSEFHG